MRKALPLLLLFLVLASLSACSKKKAEPPAEPVAEPVTENVAPLENAGQAEGAEPPEPTDAVPIKPEVKSTEQIAVGPAREAVAKAGLIDAAWLEKARVRTTTVSNVIHITFLPADRHALGRSAIVKLRADDFSVIDIEHFR